MTVWPRAFCWQNRTTVSPAVPPCHLIVYNPTTSYVSFRQDGVSTMCWPTLRSCAWRPILLTFPAPHCFYSRVQADSKTAATEGTAIIAARPGRASPAHSGKLKNKGTPAELRKKSQAFAKNITKRGQVSEKKVGPRSPMALFQPGFCFGCPTVRLADHVGSPCRPKRRRA